MRLFILTLLLILPTIFAIPAVSGDNAHRSFETASLDLHTDRKDLRLRGLSGQLTLDREGKTSSRYPKCRRARKRSGFAHYTGWKLIGDDVTGGVPVSPRPNCLKLCNNYGASCLGTFFSDETRKCFLKGTKTESWKFVETGDEEDSIDLVGGCAAWSNIVPWELDEICCRD
ncbi:uncharacterized protein IL334_005807 [Kwoniella shivajii]|uniref:Apple domain-containing protein n=1 Tax=Kwoniella shivajii TaxID=564305 RepID=A0ABZ1D463_9TREE|nr:hypothetical protein IL334_005807 [Kwoniella shivajii]